MKFRKNNIKTKTWLYLALFSVAILTFLWFFQVVFLDTYYERYKSKQLIETLSEIKIHYDNDSLDFIAHDSGVCIQITNTSGITYSSSMYNRGCIIKNFENSDYIKDFINSEQNFKAYKIINPQFNNKTIVYALRLQTGIYAFVSASLEPLDSTITILTSQFVYVTLLVLVLSFLIAYFISKRLSKPIIEINRNAKELSKRNFDVQFSETFDIEEIDELAKTLNHTKDELSKTENLRREILANISHDLKTPLTMIKAYAEMLRDLQMEPSKQAENLNVIIDETDRLNILVNDILEVSKLQARTSELEYKEFDISEFIESILKKYAIYEKEGYTISLENAFSCKVYADRKRMEQVMHNLMNNAINYTGEDKKILIRCSHEKEFVKIEVIDTGKGIEKKDIEFIWDKYYKIDRTYSRNHAGTGLGLSIVKNILTMHGVPFGVTSNQNKGTNFYFCIKKATKKKNRITLKKDTNKTLKD